MDVFSDFAGEWLPGGSDPEPFSLLGRIVVRLLLLASAATAFWLLWLMLQASVTLAEMVL